MDTVVGLAEMLCDRSRDVSAAAREEMIEQLALSARAAHHAMRNLVLAELLARGELEASSGTVDLRELIESVAQDWTVAVRETTIVITGSSQGVGDPLWIGRAVRNLIEDAVERGGRNIDIRILESYSKVVVEIEDDGEASPEDFAALGATPQRHPEAAPEGRTSGIGVSVARGLARLMHGDIRLAPNAGNNTYEFNLPRPIQSGGRRGLLPRIKLSSLDGKPRPGDLADVIDDGSISMVFQSIVDIRTDPEDSKVIGHESFARFPYASPADWFKLAGSSGRGLELELLALRAGIEGFAAQDDRSFLALNLSNSTLLSPRLAESIRGIDPGRLVLELSDTARISSYQVTRKAVDSLRERGVRLAVDDVGASQIDMWHILRLDPEIIKLDRHLVADPQNVRRNNALIRGITTMAQDLGIVVIAEAIETEAERARLLDLGVEFGQGYLFGKPAPLVQKDRVMIDAINE